MAKRKEVKRKRKKVSETGKSSRLLHPANVSKTKLGKVLKNLITFLILLIASIFLYSQSETDFWINFFLLLSVLFGLLVLAFLIVLLIFLFLKVFKK